MEQVPERWRNETLAFALALAGEGENFPKRVLSLLDRHFGVQRSIFFPHSHSFLPEGGPRRGGGPGGYISYGISYGPMYDYKDHVYRDDIFRYSALPEQLRGKSVLFTDDLMSFAQFEETPFGRHMMAVDLYYQACLFLYWGDRVVASIALLRTREEGPWDEEDRALFIYLARLIEQHYRGFLQQSGEARLLDGFGLFFQDLKMGAAVLNQDLTVVQANQAAQEVSQLFREQFRSGQGQILRSNSQGQAQFRPVQSMVNEIAERLIGQGNHCLTVSAVGGEINFYHATVLSVNASGAIQTWHLLTMTGQTRALPPDLDHPYSSLTQQERRIVYFLSTGMKNEQIAEDLHISIYTVRTHIANIYKKFEVGNKVDLLMCLQPYLKPGNGEAATGKKEPLSVGGY